MRRPCSRRRFLGIASGAPLALSVGCGSDSSTKPFAGAFSGSPSAVGVAITRAPRHGERGGGGDARAFGLLGGVPSSLVRNKTVVVKVNLTGWPYPGLCSAVGAGETYVTHGDTALALAQILTESGARRVRFVESQGVELPLEDVVAAAGWNVRALQAIGAELENTRNLGRARLRALAIPTAGGSLVLEVNHSYAEADVFVSLCKMKEHATAAGITLSMKNLFGITPNSSTGARTREDKLGYRGTIHGKAEGWGALLPGEKPGFGSELVGVRVPRTIVDENLAVRCISRSSTASAPSAGGGLVELRHRPDRPGRHRGRLDALSTEPSPPR